MVGAFLTVARLSDYVGRKPMILSALGLNALALLLFFVANSAAMLILARAVQGVATGSRLRRSARSSRIRRRSGRRRSTA